VTGQQGPRVAELGELELLRRLRPYLDHEAPGLEVGAGDDAAVWHPGGERDVVVTTDSLVEGVHFLPCPGNAEFYTSLGWKLLAISLSDLAAMGAEPGPALLALALPGGWLAADVEALYQGLAECAEKHGATLAGGNLSDAATAVLTSTCLGHVPPGRALRREGAEPGWKLACTGRLGGAAAALRLRQDPGAEAAMEVAEATRAAWVRRFRRPEPRLAAAQALVEEGMRVCLDISDGLYLDAARLLRVGLGAVIEPALLPIEPGVRETFPGAWIEIAGGGEDYELLFAGPAEKVETVCRRVVANGLPATVIGAFDSGTGVRLRDAEVGESQPPPAGHVHFAG
jgi:thiamine-monophosphate kinase